MKFSSILTLLPALALLDAMAAAVRIDLFSCDADANPNDNYKCFTLDGQVYKDCQIDDPDVASWDGPAVTPPEGCDNPGDGKGAVLKINNLEVNKPMQVLFEQLHDEGFATTTTTCEINVEANPSTPLLVWWLPYKLWGIDPFNTGISADPAPVKIVCTQMTTQPA